MNLPLLFARRYLLAKRSTNAINVITGISIGVIAVVTAAMVIAFSAVNGIAERVDTIYSPFDQTSRAYSTGSCKAGDAPVAFVL